MSNKRPRDSESARMMLHLGNDSSEELSGEEVVSEGGEVRMEILWSALGPASSSQPPSSSCTMASQSPPSPCLPSTPVDFGGEDRNDVGGEDDSTNPFPS